MIIPVQRLRFHPHSPFKMAQMGAKERLPLIWDRIDRRIRAGRPNLILLEGGGQCGKTTLGQMFCSHYDPEYVTVYSVRELMDLMDVRVAAFEAGERWMLWKWILFDEVMADVPRASWHNQRNIVLGQIVGMWGELKTNLVMTMPDIDDISPKLFRNIAIRIIVDAEWRIDHIQRTAFFFSPKKDIQKKGYKWKGAGMYPIPDYQRPEGYLEGKVSNIKAKFSQYRADMDRQDNRHKPKDTNYIPTKPTPERLAEIEAILNKHDTW